MQTLTVGLHPPSSNAAIAAAPECRSDELPDAAAEDVLAVAALSGLLGQPTRVRVVCLLACGEPNVGGLCAALRLPQPVVSHHLGLLRRGGVLDCRRAGKQVYYGWSRRLALDPDGTLTMTARGVSVRVRLTSTDPTSASPMGRQQDALPEGEATVALATAGSGER